MFLGSAGLRPHFFLLEDRRKESTHLRAHFCHVSKTACLVALKFKSTEKRALISKTACLVAHTFKSTALVGLILVGAHNEEQIRGYTIDEEVRHP